MKVFMMHILQSLLLRLKCNGEPDSLLVGVPVGFAVGLGVGFGALVGLVIGNFCGNCCLQQVCLMTNSVDLPLGSETASYSSLCITRGRFWNFFLCFEKNRYFIFHLN